MTHGAAALKHLVAFGGLLIAIGAAAGRGNVSASSVVPKSAAAGTDNVRPASVALKSAAAPVTNAAVSTASRTSRAAPVTKAAVPIASRTSRAASIDLADLITLKTPGDPQVSPDGRTVAFTVAWADTIESRTHVDIYTAAVDGRAGIHPLVDGPENETAPRWSPDGRYLAFVMSRSSGDRVDGTAFQDSSGGTRPQVWLISPDSGAHSRRLTSAPEGVESYQWMPDGRSVVYRTTATLSVAERARRDEERRRKMDAIVEGLPRRPREFWSQPLTDTPPRRLLVADAGVDDWDLSPDGRTIVYATNYTGLPDDENRFDLWVFSIGRSRPRQLTFRHGPDTHPAISPDGRRVAYQADQDSSVTFSQEEIFIVPLSGGTPRWLTRSLDLPATAPRWSADGREVRFEVAVGPDNTFFEMRPDGQKLRGLSAMPPDDDSTGTFRSELSRSGDGSVMAWIGEGPSAWADVWISKTGSPARRLTDFDAALDPLRPALPEVQAFQWLSRDLIPINGFLVRPRGNRGRPPYPTIAYPHGGPYNRSTRRLRGIPTSVVLASRGYLVLEPNYRGSRGFSEKFGQASRNDLGGRDLDDVISGLDWLVRNDLADSSRLGIAGGSYGGYLTNWAIANTNRFKAAVTYYGIFNFITDFSNATSPSYEREYFGAYYWEGMGEYYRRSPISRVAAIHTPVLILHGDEDPKTSIANAREMWTALRILHRTVEFVHYPRERHGFSEPNHRIDAARRTVAWFERFMPARTK